MSFSLLSKTSAATPVAFRALMVFGLLGGIKDRPAVAVTRFNGSAGQRARQGPGEKKAQIVI
jgi:hypothetical protein